MRLTPPNSVRARAFAVLDARLQPDVPHPVALALSGGGDSMALMQLAADWARGRGRRLLALTVDHGLNPDSGDWTAFAARAATAVGADWRGLSWTGDKPATGLTAAARAARHALIADAARAAGVRVILTAHTADDVAEADWMRAEGSTLGRLRDWSPSPAWPEGRGLMLLRPLLGVRRADLRDSLRAAGTGWIDDPANLDPRFARSRARHALSGATPVAMPAPPMPSADLPADQPCAGFGAVRLSRDVSRAGLAAAVVSAGGGAVTPRGVRLDRLAARLAGAEDFTAVLCGARIAAAGSGVTVLREAGEQRRRPPQAVRLAPGRPAVWDGRFEIIADQPGWTVVPAAGRLAALPDADRARLAPLPPALRPTLPVLIRDDGGGPVLAGTAAAVRCLVVERLALAVGQVTHEAGLAALDDGGMSPADLFLSDGGASATAG